MYEYRATLDRVIDGDTVDVFIDLGFDIIKSARIRLLGIDTPELRSKEELEKQAAQDAKAFVEKWFHDCEIDGVDIFVRTHKSDKYGRYLGVFFTTGQDDSEYLLNQQLLDEGLAKEYDGGKR